MVARLRSVVRTGGEWKFEACHRTSLSTEAPTTKTRHRIVSIVFYIRNRIVVAAAAAAVASMLPDNRLVAALVTLR